MRAVLALIADTPVLADRIRVYLIGSAITPFALALVKTASESACPHCFIFIPALAGIQPYYRAADVMVSSSQFESMSMTILEAMAMKIPVLSTRTHGTNELVDHDHTGLLVPTIDYRGQVDQRVTVRHLKKGLRRFLEMSSAQLQEIGLAGRRAFEVMHCRTLGTLPSLLQALHDGDDEHTALGLARPNLLAVLGGGRVGRAMEDTISLLGMLHGWEEQTTGLQWSAVLHGRTMVGPGALEASTALSPDYHLLHRMGKMPSDRTRLVDLSRSTLLTAGKPDESSWGEMDAMTMESFGRHYSKSFGHSSFGVCARVSAPL